jgi:hypothetical protein
MEDRVNMNEVEKIIANYIKHIVSVEREKDKLIEAYKNLLCYGGISVLFNVLLLFLWLWELNR